MNRKHELIATMKENWDKLAKKRNIFFKWKENYLCQYHLRQNEYSRTAYISSLLCIRLRLLRRTSLSRSLAKWTYFASNRKHQRLRVINLMKTSRISIYRRAIRKWKTFVHEDRLCSYESMSHDRIVSSRIRIMERLCLRKSFHQWQIYWRKLATWRLVISRMVAVIRNSHVRAAFSRLKYCATRLKTKETTRLQQDRLLQNLAGSKKYRTMNKMLNRWIMYIKWILKRNAALRSILVHKSISQSRAALRIWHKKCTNDRMRYRCLVRLSLLVSKQRCLLAMTKWKKNIQILKIEDALCLGHDAMRKTKVDMAKRLYSRARRARLNGAMLKWKAETQNDRTMEEHANAVEAMSNWAARIAGGRILKERFQMWMAFVQKMILERTYKMAILNAVTLRFVKSSLCVAFQVWKEDMYKYALNSSRNTMLEKHLAIQDDHDKHLRQLLKLNRKVTLRNILLRLVKADLTKGFYTWKHFSNGSKLKEVHDFALQKQKKLESAYSNQVTSLTSEQNTKIKELEIHHENKFVNMKNLHMERLESMETKHASFIKNIEADWSSKLEEQENNHRNVIEHARDRRLEIEEKYNATLDKLKSRHTKYWRNLNKSQVFRTWRECALMLRLQRNRKKSTIHIFNSYNRLRRKHSFARWHVYTRNRMHKRAILGHIFGSSMRRKIFVFFHFWRHRYQEHYRRSLNDQKQLSVAISSWRQLENKRIRKTFYVWRTYVSHSIKKHQTIVWLFKWKRHHTLLRGWRKLKDSTSQLSYFINMNRKHELIATMKENWDKLAKKRNIFFKWKEKCLHNKHFKLENSVHLRLLQIEKKVEIEPYHIFCVFV